MTPSLPDKSTYPQLAEYLHHRMPIVRSNAAVLRALRTCGHLTDAQIDHALSWGNLPYVSISNFVAHPCGNVPGNTTYGCTRRANLNAIEVSKVVVEQFEKSAGTGSDNKNSRGSTV